MLTLVGLTLAMSTISSCLIYLESNRADFYLDFFENEFDDENLEYRQDFESTLDLMKEGIFNSHTLLKNNIAAHGLNQILSENLYGPLCMYDGSLSFLNQSFRRSFYGLNITNSLLEECLEGSYLPTVDNEVILMTEELGEVAIGDNINISVPYYLSPEGGRAEYLNRSIKITGLITSSSLQETSPLLEFRHILRNYHHYGHFLLLTSLDSYLSFFQELNTDLSQIINHTHQFPSEIYSTFSVVKEQISSKNVRYAMTDLLRYIEDTRGSFSLNNTYYYGRGNIIYQLRSKETEFGAFFFSFLLISIPAFLLTILLVNYSLGIINERRQKSLILFKSRGVSDKFILLALLSEVLVLMGFATLGGLVVGIPFAMLISMTVGYLKFDINSLLTGIIITPTIVQTVLFFSFLFLLLTYIRPMVRLTRSSITTIEKEASRKKKRKARIFRGNLDLILLTQGTLGIIILVIFLEIIIKSDLNTMGGLFLLFLPLIVFLAFLSPFTFLIGFILSFNRFIPVIIHHLGNFFWQKDWGLFATAARNLSVNIKSTGRMTLIIACALSFLMILSILPLSIQQNTVNQVYYEIGCDMAIPFWETNTTRVQEIETNLALIEGLKTTIVTEGRWYYETSDTTGYSIGFFGIDEEFKQVVHWKSSYDDQPIQDLTSALFTSSSPYPVIIDSISAQQEQIRIKDNFNPSSEDSGHIGLTIEGITSFWPGFIRRERIEDRFVIIPRTKLINLSLNVPSTVNSVQDLQERIWCKFSPGVDINSVVLETKNVLQQYGIYSDRPIVAQDQMNVNPDTLSDKFVWVITNFNFITALAAILLIVIMFTFTRITNYATEIGLSRALGMKYQQVFLLMFIEPLLLFILSGIPGGLAGVLILFGFVSLFASSLLSGPPFILNFNLPTLIFIYSAILIVTIMAGLISSYIATRANISTILQVE
ncbi:MAG: FtsX-like permease family protein [Candidatus Hodarchaeales archaeon]|jgi:ABC-type antimicrobial peptide transport system permease subunit